MKGFFLKLWLVFSLVAFVVSPCNRVNSCISYPEWYDTRMVFFNPELGEDNTGLRPFFYSDKLFFSNDYDGFYDVGRSNTENDYRRNCLEWQQYLGGRVTLDDIHHIVYGSDADDFMTAYSTKTLNTVFSGNTFVKALLQPRHEAALEYLDFAKRFEFQQFTYVNDPWNDEQRYSWQRDSTGVSKLADESLRKLAAATNPFLRKRWAYQVINTGYYAPERIPRDSLQRIFSRNFDIRNDTSVLMPWALLKIAEMNPNRLEANYQFSRVFDRCQSKRIRAMQLFQSASADATLRYAKKPEEKAAILTIRAMQNPGRGLADLQQIARICPNSPYLPLLITREINKVEDWLLTTRLSGMAPWVSSAPDYDWDENYDRKMSRWRRINAEKDQVYMARLRQFLQDCAVGSRRRARLLPLLQLAVAHLYFIENKYPESWQVLQQIKPGADKRWALQKQIQELLLIPHRRDVTRPTTQAALVRRLLYVRQNAQVMAQPAVQLGRIYLALSHAFFNKKDIATAGLLFGRAALNTATRNEHWWGDYSAHGFYDNLASIADMERLERLLDKKHKTAFEQFVTGPFVPVEVSPYPSEWGYFIEDNENPSPVPVRNKIHDLKGTFAFRDGNLARAWREFEQVDTAYWEGGWDVDFCGSADLIAADTLPYSPGNTKARLVKKMLDLATEAARNPAKRTLNYYLLGNAWYHCSYWGHASGMFAAGKSNDDTDRPDQYRRGPTYLSNQPDPKRFGAVYYRCRRAARFFQRALDQHPDPELAARAFYMLAECDRRDRWMTARRQGESSRVQEGDVASPYFRIWAKRYGKTAAYEECIERCPGLRTYLGL